MIEGISAVTLGTHEMSRAVRFYRALGLRFCMRRTVVIHQPSSRASYLNLIAQPAERRWSWWGRVIFYVADVQRTLRPCARGGIPASYRAPRCRMG